MRPGEILGFAGLVGAGAPNCSRRCSACARARAKSGSTARAQHWRDARAGMRAGAVYLTEDRKGKGLLLEETIAANLTLAALDKFQRGPLVDRAKEARALDEAIRRFDIRVGDKDLARRPDVGRQPAEAAARQDDAARSAKSSSSTSRRAASTSAPSSRSIASSPRSPRKGAR